MKKNLLYAQSGGVTPVISGTSADAIDVAWLAGDGEDQVRPGPKTSVAYAASTRAAILDLVRRGWTPRTDTAALARAITLEHFDALTGFLREHGLGKPDLVGFHGQTVWHDPARGVTVLFGGNDLRRVLQDTWTWDGSRWTQLSGGPAPPPRVDCGITYDLNRARVVMYGGQALPGQ